MALNTCIRASTHIGGYSLLWSVNRIPITDYCDIVFLSGLLSSAYCNLAFTPVQNHGHTHLPFARIFSSVQNNVGMRLQNDQKTGRSRQYTKDNKPRRECQYNAHSLGYFFFFFFRGGGLFCSQVRLYSFL